MKQRKCTFIGIYPTYFDDVGEQVDCPGGEGVEKVDGANRGHRRPQRRPPLGSALEAVDVELREGDEEERGDQSEGVELRWSHRVRLGK